LATDPNSTHTLRDALSPAAIRAAMVPGRPVFGNPWDSEGDMFACYFAISVIDPLLLMLGAGLMSSIFGFGSHWPLGVFMVAALVGAAGFMTIVGRQRTGITLDVLAIAAWVVLGLVVAPVIGLAPSAAVAIVLYAVMLVGIFAYVLRVGYWQTAFLRTLTWPVTWSAMALFFSWVAYKLILFT
jgi:hypothetical protein